MSPAECLRDRPHQTLQRNIVAAGSKAKKSLYLEDLASFTDTALYDQKDATGFIKLFGLPMKVAGLVSRHTS
jgi:argininosuccinate synthase